MFLYFINEPSTFNHQVVILKIETIALIIFSYIIPNDIV